MMCRFIGELLGLYFDGRLIPFQARLVERHLRTCGGCAARLAELKKLGLELRGLSVPAAPAGLKDSLKAALAAAAKGPAAAAEEETPVRELDPVPAPSLSFAFSFAAFLLFVCGSMFGPGLPSQGCSDASNSVCAPKGE
jgi:anti-sigma factor RsiW